MESDNSLQSWIPRLLRFLTGRKQNLNERSEKTEKTSHAVTEEDTPQNQPDDQNHSIDQKLLNSEACSLSRRTESPGPDLLRESLRRSKSQFPGHTEVATANLSLAYSLSAVLQSLGDVIFSTSTPVEKLRGKEFPQKHQKGESSNLLLGNIFSAEKQVVSSLTTNLCSGIKRDCTHNRFLGLGGNVDVELTDKGGNRYSVCFPAAGSYMWPATNLGFVVRAAVTVEMAFASWGQHLDLALQHHEQWMVAGPLFDITAEPGEAIAEIYLPHFIALQAGEVDVAWFQITHFKDEGMVLEQPARVAPLYAVLENPSFSLMGVLLRIASGTRLSVPITSTTLLYYHTHPEECKFHLYLIPSDASITKKIDEEEAHFQGKRLQTSPPLEPLNFGSRYVLSGSTHLEITPKEMRLSYRSPGEIHPFSKVYAGQMTEKIQLEITDKRLGTLVWETSVKPVDLQFCAASATPSFSGAAFMKKYRRSLQARMGDLGGVLDDLQDCEVLTENEKELVEQAPTRQKRNETLLRLVENKGGQALEKLYESLSERDPYLMNSIRQPSFSQ
ncbi:caspase recruitment domain-containing protein 8 isoform X6 [Dasypus novemcinctus]|uniref:caspase recruitment domain-containing protein 8 isoform X6 n=1 Tax=Dasypus novemcinctus TaxID=9361 RepID=UPI000328BAD5|nr:caspase recruitment domain-containing protein 8 isoform X4 [Dasypus novemcinctus]XP_012379380.1 caspase recruitment domain-containing protein 8 isoform X4 [Dasypus novemcinctus]